MRYEKDVFKRIFSYSDGAIWAFILAIIMAMINGAIFPVFTIYLSKMLAVLVGFANPSIDRA